jgi:hypothetical protein
MNREIKNNALQLQLTSCVQACEECSALIYPSQARSDAIFNFCKTFVPCDISEDDVTYFSNNLINDEVDIKIII